MMNANVAVATALSSAISSSEVRALSGSRIAVSSALALGLIQQPPTIEVFQLDECRRMSS
jgi:hypothetical protein